MAKGAKKGNGSKKQVKEGQNVKVVCKPQSRDARKEINVHELKDDSLSWSSDDDQSHTSVDFAASERDKEAFVEAQNRREKWIASVQTLASSIWLIVQPSPHPMQQLVSNATNSSVSSTWRHSLFHNIVDEGLNLEIHVVDVGVIVGESSDVNVVKIIMEDIKQELEYWQSFVVCYILEVKPPLRIVKGFIRRISKKYGIVKVVVLKFGVFMVRFHNVDSKNQALEAGPILHDSKPVIVKEWSLEVDITTDCVKMVPTWIKLPNLPLQYWEQVA